MEVVTRPWRHLADYRGRATRTEFLLFNLVWWLPTFILLLVGSGDGSSDIDHHAAHPGLVLIGMGLAVILVVPSLSLSVRRLHDWSASGWWLLTSIIPAIGSVIVLVLMLWPGARGANRYGENPRLGDIGAVEVPGRILP